MLPILGESETRAADYRAGLYQRPFPDLRAFAQGDPGHQATVLADAAVRPNDAARTHEDPRTYLGPLLHHGRSTDPGGWIDAGSVRNYGARMATAGNRRVGMQQPRREGVRKVRIRAHQGGNGAQIQIPFRDNNRRGFGLAQLRTVLSIREKAQTADACAPQGIDPPYPQLAVPVQLGIELIHQFAKL
jgi:hypothetical protein